MWEQTFQYRRGLGRGLMTCPACPGRRGHRVRRGFTLVELMVAIAVLAIMAVMSWRGLDAMVRAKTLTAERADQVVTTQSVLAQWRADLDALVQTGRLRPVDWDGQVLRMTRQHPNDPALGVLVVGWSARTVGDRTQWLRWQSPAVRDRAGLAAAWLAAQQWARTPTADTRASEVPLTDLSSWQVYFFRSNAWSSPFSSADPQQAQQLASDVSIPDGVRLELTLPAAHALGGKVVLDWVRPVRSGGHN